MFGIGIGMSLWGNVAAVSGGGLGPELLTNGTFTSNSSPPTIGGGCTISGGVLNCTSATVPATWTSVVTVGNTYRVQLDYTSTSGSASANLRVTNSGTIMDVEALAKDSAAHHMVFIDFVATGTGIAIEADGDVYTGTLDNISCKQVL